MDFLNSQYVSFDVHVHTPEEAIESAGRLLVENGDVEERYVEKMIESFHQHGPYIVIAPQIAMPHARPEDGVKHAALSMVRLTKEIVFGHQSNDPVKLVFALAASSSENHLALLQKLSILLSDKSHVDQLLTAKSYEEIEPIIKGM